VASAPDLRPHLERAALLGELPPDARDELVRAARPRRLRAGQYLWRVGDREEGLAFVLQGLMQIGVPGAEGDEIVLHVVGPGECMGEPGIYAAAADRRTDARAAGPALVATIAGARVRAALERSPEAMRVFVRRVSEIARGHARRLALNAFHDGRGRVARLLLDLADSHGVPHTRGRRIDLPLSQRALAGLVNLRRESVNRLLAAFERDGALTLDEGSVTLLRPELLVAAIGADASTT